MQIHGEEAGGKEPWGTSQFSLTPKSNPTLHKVYKMAASILTLATFSSH